MIGNLDSWNLLSTSKHLHLVTSEIKTNGDRAVTLFHFTS